MSSRTQKQIMQQWNSNSPCLVSIICIAYNHELYIQGAIESFLMQETDFPFEIIIHDDASTDKTADIIKQYQIEFPVIIKPIFQTENQYSKGGFKPSFHAFEFSKGKYIAHCEGDDFWIDKEKLQIQIKAMQQHPHVNISTHSGYLLQEGKQSIKPSWCYGQDQVFDVKFILNCAGRSFAPTASYVVKREIMENMPDWFFSTAPVGDFFLEMYAAKQHGALYIDKAMCVYRVASPDSWRTRTSITSTNYLKHKEKMLESLDLMEKDFTACSQQINKRRSSYLCDKSGYYLLNKENKLFLTCIEESVRLYSFVTKKQSLLFKFRRYPFVLRTVYLIKGRIISLLVSLKIG